MVKKTSEEGGSIWAIASVIISVLACHCWPQLANGFLHWAVYCQPRARNFES